jgi:hypothetical protein
MMTVGLTVTSNAECAGYYGSTTVVSSTICTAADPSKSICSVKLKNERVFGTHNMNVIFRVIAAAR